MEELTKDEVVTFREMFDMMAAEEQWRWIAKQKTHWKGSITIELDNDSTAMYFNTLYDEEIMMHFKRSIGNSLGAETILKELGYVVDVV